MFEDLEQESMKDLLTGDKLTKLRYLFDKFMKPIKSSFDPDIQYQASVQAMRQEILKNNDDISVSEFDTYFQDYKAYINNIEFSKVIHQLEN